jgi:hypothetical protein
MDKLTNQEKEQALKEFEQRQEKRYKTGKAIVFTIATVNILGTVATSFGKFNLFSLLIQIALSIALFCGVSWVRYFFAAGAALSVFSMLYLLAGLSSGANIPVLIIVFIVAYMAYGIASSIVLFASKSVSWFLYGQKNG